MLAIQLKKITEAQSQSAVSTSCVSAPPDPPLSALTESEAELKVKQLLKLNCHQQGHLVHKLPPAAKVRPNTGLPVAPRVGR